VVLPALLLELTGIFYRLPSSDKMKLLFLSLITVAFPTRYVVNAGQPDPDQGVLSETADGEFEYFTEPEARTAGLEFDGIVEDMNWDQYHGWNNDEEDRGTSGGDPGTDPPDNAAVVKLSLVVQDEERQRRNCNRSSVATTTQGGSASVKGGCRRLRGISHH
jgi:hypothetical protein